MEIKSTLDVLEAINNRKGLIEVLTFLKDKLNTNMAGLSMDFGMNRQTVFGYMKGNPIPAGKEEIMWQVLRRKYIEDEETRGIMELSTTESDAGLDRGYIKEMCNHYVGLVKETEKLYIKHKTPQTFRYLQYCIEELEYYNRKLAEIEAE